MLWASLSGQCCVEGDPAFYYFALVMLIIVIAAMVLLLELVRAIPDGHIT